VAGVAYAHEIVTVPNGPEAYVLAVVVGDWGLRAVEAIPRANPRKARIPGMADVRPKFFLYKGRRLDEWLPDIVERVVERFDPLKIILFGSLARGEMGYDSDIDLFVIFDEVKWEDKRKLTVEIRRSIADLPVPVDVIIADLDEIRRRGKIIGTVPHAALHEGKALYDRS